MFFADPERLTSAVPWPIDEWKTHYPYWDEPNVLPRERMGDCYAMIVDTILTLASPFPGDTLYDAKHIRPELRFHVKRLTGTRDYIIRDRLTGERQYLTCSLLRTQNLMLATGTQSKD